MMFVSSLYFNRIPHMTLVTVLLLLLSLSSSSVLAQPKQGQAWVEACRDLGFDPAQLACQTCEWLPQQHQAACRDCCQSYKDTFSLRQPYQAAVLVIPNQQLDAELQTFLDQDWDDLVQRTTMTTTAANKQPALQKVIKPVESRTTGGGGFWSFFQRTPAELHFLEQPLSSSQLSNNDLVKQMAKETITLYGWKREDIKDMIQTLLVQE